MAAKLGIQKREKLKPDAVPTIFERNKQHAAPLFRKDHPNALSTAHSECVCVCPGNLGLNLWFYIIE